MKSKKRYKSLLSHFTIWNTLKSCLQYVIYDIDNFIADVGGYLGLLLGQSIYGIYEIFTKCAMARAAKCVLPQ